MPDIPDLPKAEAAIIEFTNEFRRSEKLSPVKPNAELTATARLFAAYLAKSGRFAHEADGRQPAERATASGYRFCMIAENLALNQDSRGFATTALAKQAVEGWKNSPGHRRNMVEPHVTEIGVGIAKAPDGDPKYLSVQLFGRPESSKYQFKIENKAGVAVAYTALGARKTVEPRVTVTYTVCTPGVVTFERAGNWLTGTKLDARFETRSGTTYVLTTGADGRVKIDAVPTAGK